MSSYANLTPSAADQKFARAAWIRALERTAPVDRGGGLSMACLIDDLAERYGDAPALLSREDAFSYRQFADHCRRYARWGRAAGLMAGDTVALLMPNKAEYLAVWIGLSRLGVRVALVNTNLEGEPLRHSIAIVAPKLIIVDRTLAAVVTAIRVRLPKDLHYWVYGDSSGDFAALAPALLQVAGARLDPSEFPPPLLDSTALFIYTSGTTGLPKAAHVSHYRVMRWSLWFCGLLNTNSADRMYDCLPLYHSVGGVVATGATLAGGGSVVIRPRFSASEFWADVRESGSTLFQYIGELCRYLVNSPPQVHEADHSLRIACGNGLRAEVWIPFQRRFRIPRVLEYYASTEGNFSLYNCEGRPGAIGRIPSFLSHRLQVALVRFDVDAGEPLRDSTGRCERCATDEVGEAIGLIGDRDEARAGRFEGYADPEASARKVLRDVFAPGDAWYRTGDLMRRDEQGFFYFVDRVGETYRWKGENVSTAEVLSALVAAPGVLDGVVYGVEVPGADGRAGMAALVVAPDFDLAAFRADVATRLPAFARPVFLRIVPALQTTGTFKRQTKNLVLAGFEPSRIEDPVYFDDARAGRYIRIDADFYANIVNGIARL